MFSIHQQLFSSHFPLVWKAARLLTFAETEQSLTSLQIFHKFSHPVPWPHRTIKYHPSLPNTHKDTTWFKAENQLISGKKQNQTHRKQNGKISYSHITILRVNQLYFTPPARHILKLKPFTHPSRLYCYCYDEKQILNAVLVTALWAALILSENSLWRDYSQGGL